MEIAYWRRILKLWMPPLVGIAGMLILAYYVGVARFFLFTHHLFYMLGIFLLINPITETFWPSAAPQRKGKPKPQPSAKARARAEARKFMQKHERVSASKTPGERLPYLRHQKERVDQQIEELVRREKEPTGK